MADGLTWYLPMIDCELLVLNPPLIREFSKAFDLAVMVDRDEDDIKGMTIRSALCHAQFAQLAVILLEVNYDLPDERWRDMTAFARITDMLRMTLVVAEVVAASVEVWMPFCLTNGVAGRDNLRLN